MIIVFTFRQVSVSDNFRAATKPGPTNYGAVGYDESVLAGVFSVGQQHGYFLLFFRDGSGVLLARWRGLCDEI